MVCFALAGLAAPLSAADADACKGRNVRRLGGAHAVLRPAIKNVADLQKRLPELEASIRAAVAKDPSLDPGVADAVVAAIRSGAGISERELGRTEAFNWMAYQPKKGDFEVIAPPCVRLNRDYDAFELTVEVPEPVPAPPADAVCAISAQRNCEHDNPTISIDIDGSRRDPRVKMAATGQPASAVALSGSKAAIADPQPYSADFQFTVRAEGSVASARMARVHRFVIPKVCGNLAYLGEGPRRQIADPAASTSCEKSVTAPMCKPWAAIGAAGAPALVDAKGNPIGGPGGKKIEKGSSVTITPAGGWHTTSSKLEVTGPAGSTPLVVENPTGPVTYTPTVPTCGEETYKVRFETKNANGDSAAATSEFQVAPHDWIARGFLLSFAPRGDEQKRGLTVPVGASASEKFELDRGTGVGASMEHLLDPRWGLEGVALLGRAKSKYTLSSDGESGSDSHNANFYALTFGPNLHLLACAPVDLYLGAFAGFGGFADPNYWALGHHFQASFDGRFVYGAQLGLDLPFGKASDWGLHGGVRYLKLDQKTDAGTLKVDPLAVELGLAYRF
jgi:outer membrane protein W